MFCIFLAGHESLRLLKVQLALQELQTKQEKKPLRVILNGLGKDAAYIISRINGFYLCGDRV